MAHPPCRLRALLLASSLGLAAAAAPAAVLDFASSATFDQQYGDLPGLLDISYTYHLGANSGLLSWWDAGYDELRGVAWGSQIAAGTVGRVTLLALDAAQPVTLASFRLGSWEGPAGRTETVTVTRIGEAAPAFSFTGTIGADNLSNLFAPGLVSASGFVIEWTNPWWTAMDNLDVSVAASVPEPGAGLLMALGLGVYLLPKLRAASRADRRAAPEPARIPAGDRPMHPSDEGLA
jgi:hypothetical protein